ncbi:osmotically-inducible protein OsmY [Chryseobacterium ginsenosidimutans]|jgi:osmotically-inducible protein OsmY|uniref:BON domain-containing protein n=1 Tax=Chryseobacterium ginsenosidimutans TaxID=687846 RepID=UPI00216A29DA|nr:BON domain-containing protein [Chryseobacterium ginsenosidimutans]MCS3869366.1 osmotically-inducible protein OsmY [Chryseobacterium ginsenosidimutans]
MKTNAELQKDVQDAIKWEPLLNSAEIGVIVKNGIVTLTGTVDSYAKKLQAEHATKNVSGVKILVEDIEVKLPDPRSKTDVEIAGEIIAAFNANSFIPQEKITVKVENGWVDLDGEVSWEYIRDITENAIRYLPGVKGIYNNITINPEIQNTVEKKDVEQALKRSSIDSSEINVSVSGTTVTLTGNVHTWHQKEEAGRIVWKTPGIQDVKNELTVDYEYDL